MLGDSFPVGCAPSGVMLPDNTKNLDHKHPLYGTENGIYLSGCGISNLMMSWGKDESLDSKIQHATVGEFCSELLHFSRFQHFILDAHFCFWISDESCLFLCPFSVFFQPVDITILHFQKRFLRIFPGLFVLRSRLGISTTC